MSECQTTNVDILNIYFFNNSLPFCHYRLFLPPLTKGARGIFPYNSPLNAFFKTDFFNSSKSANFCL